MMKYINEHIDKVYTMNKYIKHVKESSNINAYLMILPRTSKYELILLIVLMFLLLLLLLLMLTHIVEQDASNIKESDGVDVDCFMEGRMRRVMQGRLEA